MSSQEQGVLCARGTVRVPCGWWVRGVVKKRKDSWESGFVSKTGIGEACVLCMHHSSSKNLRCQGPSQTKHAFDCVPIKIPHLLEENFTISFV